MVSIHFWRVIVDPHSAIGMSVFFFMVNSLIKAFIFRIRIILRYVLDMLPVSIIFTVIGSIMVGIISDFWLYMAMLVIDLFIFSTKKIIRALGSGKKNLRKTEILQETIFGKCWQVDSCRGPVLAVGAPCGKAIFCQTDCHLSPPPPENARNDCRVGMSMVLGGVATLLRLGTDQVQFLASCSRWSICPRFSLLRRCLADMRSFAPEWNASPKQGYHWNLPRQRYSMIIYQIAQVLYCNVA